MAAFIITKMIHLSITRPKTTRKHTSEMYGKQLALETTVGCPITRGATGHVRITIVKMHGSLRDIREAWVTLALESEEKPHLSCHKCNDETPGPVVEESRVSARRVLQAVGDRSHEERADSLSRPIASMPKVKKLISWSSHAAR